MENAAEGLSAQWRGIRLFPFLELMEIVKRNGNVSGFEVLPRRRVVERTFAWMG